MAANLPNDIELVTRLACFGSADGTFHVLDKTLGPNQAELFKSVLKERGQHVVKRLRTIANRKSYAKKENLLFSLAATINAFGVDGSEHSTDSLCKQVYRLVEGLCENPCDLFNFIHYDKEIRTTKFKASWGRGMRSLVANFYSSKSPEVLAQQITQCKSGHGFSHKDLMRLIHLPSDRVASKGTSLVLKYALKGKKALEEVKEEEVDENVEKASSILMSVERLRQTQDTEKEIIRSIIETNSLIDKQIPTHFFKLPEVFVGLMGHMTLDFLVRSVPRMAELGMLDPRASNVQKVLDRLNDAKAFEEERISPVTVFVAQRKYDINRHKKWIRNPHLVQSLKNAYELSLMNMPSTNKRYLMACHVDDKTISKTCVTGTSCMSPLIPCLILAQMLAKRETKPDFIYFNQEGNTTELKLTKSMPSVAVLEQILKNTKGPANEDYDLCEPLRWATEKQKPFDCILLVVSKKKEKSQDEFREAISQYRTEAGVPNAKVAVLGLAGALPYPNRDDVNYMDVTGFDEEVLSLLRAFFIGLPSDDDD